MRCWNCGVTSRLKDVDPVEYKRRKSANARAAMIKARERGSKIGRPIKLNYEAVKARRKQGASLSQLAYEFGCSKSGICHALRSK